MVGINVSIVDDCHRFAALTALRAAGTSYCGQKECPQMYLERRRDREVLSARKCIPYGRSYNNLAELVVPEQRFLNTLRILMAFATTFKIDYGTSFVVARTTDIAEDLLVSTSICRAGFPVVYGTYALQSLFCAILCRISTLKVLQHLRLKSRNSTIRY